MADGFILVMVMAGLYGTLLYVIFTMINMGGSIKLLPKKKEK